MKVLDYVIPVLKENIYHKLRGKLNPIITFVGEITEHETKGGVKYLRYHIYMTCEETMKSYTYRSVAEGDIVSYKVWVDDGNCNSLREGMAKVIGIVARKVKLLKEDSSWGH